MEPQKAKIVTEVTSGCGDYFYFLFRFSAFPTYYFYDKNQRHIKALKPGAFNTAPVNTLPSFLVLGTR